MGNSDSEKIEFILDPNKIPKIMEKSIPKVKPTRIFIAKATVWGFFILLAIPLIMLIFNRLNVDDAIDLIKTIASILAGIVGMVWGFYFQTK